MLGDKEICDCMGVHMQSIYKDNMCLTCYVKEYLMEYSGVPEYWKKYRMEKELSGRVEHCYRCELRYTEDLNSVEEEEIFKKVVEILEESKDGIEYFIEYCMDGDGYKILPYISLVSRSEKSKDMPVYTGEVLSMEISFMKYEDEN